MFSAHSKYITKVLLSPDVKCVALPLPSLSGSSVFPLWPRLTSPLLVGVTGTSQPARPTRRSRSGRPRTLSSSSSACLRATSAGSGTAPTRPTRPTSSPVRRPRTPRLPFIALTTGHASGRPCSELGPRRSALGACHRRDGPPVQRPPPVRDTLPHAGEGRSRASSRLMAFPLSAAPASPSPSTTSISVKRLRIFRAGAICCPPSRFPWLARRAVSSSEFAAQLLAAAVGPEARRRSHNPAKPTGAGRLASVRHLRPEPRERKKAQRRRRGVDTTSRPFASLSSPGGLVRVGAQSAVQRAICHRMIVAERMRRVRERTWIQWDACAPRLINGYGTGGCAVEGRIDLGSGGARGAGRGGRLESGV
jgi:hypothetical protein